MTRGRQWPNGPQRAPAGPQTREARPTPPPHFDAEDDDCGRLRAGPSMLTCQRRIASISEPAAERHSHVPLITVITTGGLPEVGRPPILSD